MSTPDDLRYPAGKGPNYIPKEGRHAVARKKARLEKKWETREETPKQIRRKKVKTKLRNKALKGRLQQEQLVVATRDNTTGKLYRGVPGEIHADVVERVVQKTGKSYAQVDHDVMRGRIQNGFWVTKSGKFLTRDEAGAIIRPKFGLGAAESIETMETQAEKPQDLRKRHLRRGKSEASQKLLRKRRQAQRVHRKLKKAKAKAAGKPGRLAQIAQRAGRVRDIVKGKGLMAIAGLGDLSRASGAASEGGSWGTRFMKFAEEAAGLPEGVLKRPMTDKEKKRARTL
jgi:hypothetical protein